MANMEQYIFKVDADSTNAIQKLQEIVKLMDRIENIRNKGASDYFTTSQKDMDNNIRSMSQLTKMYKEMEKELGNIERKMRKMSDGATIPKGATKEQVREIEKLKEVSERQARAALRQQQELQDSYRRTLKNFRELASFQQNYSKNFKPAFSSNDIYNLPQDRNRARSVVNSILKDSDEATSKLDDVMAKMREIQKLDRRSESLTRRASASNYMSYQQATSFSADLARSRGSYVAERERNKESIVSLGMERDRIHNAIKDIETNPEATNSDLERKVAMQRTIESMDKEIEARIELSRTLDRTIKNMEDYNKRVQSAEVKPERGTIWGMAYERAPAIGLAMGGAVGGAFGGLYMKGSGIKQSIRDDVIAIGQRTGQDDWRTNVRDNAFEAGIQDRLGFTGQEMLAFQNTYLSKRGFRGVDDLNTAMQSQAEFSRVTGTSSERTKEFFTSLFGSANIKGGDVAGIQNAFVGAIKQSGMEGREEDQLSALEGILDQVSTGRTIDRSDVLNVMGLQSALANSGVQSLRGEKGGQLLRDMDAGFKQAIDDPMVRLVFGQGSKHQGISGWMDLTEQLEKGVSDPGNIGTVAKFIEGYTSDTKEQDALFMKFFRHNMNTDMSSEQAKGLMDAYRRGDLSQESIDAILQEDSAVGEKEAKKRLERYEGSKEATENQSEAVTGKQAVGINDLGDAVRAVNSSMGGMPPVIYGTIAALGALALTAAGTAGSLGGGALVRKGMSGKPFGDKFGTGRGPRPGGGGGGIGGLFGGLFDPNVRKGGLPNTGPSSKGGGMFSKATEGIKNIFKGEGGNPGIMAPGGGGLGGAGRLAGRLFLPLSIALGAGDVLSAPEGKKGETLGSVAGGLGGGLGGAALGATLGSVVPGIGTAIGGIAGGILGGLGGESLGGWLGGKFGKGKGGSEKEESKPNSIKEQIDRENTTKKERSETKRSDNISEESSNLTYYETLLNRAEKLLSKARMQNGIMGSPNVSDGLYNSEGGAAKLSGNGNAEKIWNFFSEKGLSSTAISGILGNLQQESGLNPKAPGGGLAQWIGGRKANLDKFAKSKGLSPDSLEAQLQFMWSEMQGGDSTFASALKKIGGISGFNKMSPGKAAEFFSKYYERPGKPMLNKRKQYADDFHGRLSGNQWSTTATSAATKSSVSSNNINVQSRFAIDIRGDETVSSKIRDSKDLANAARAIQEKIYGSMGYHANEMRRV